MSEPEGASDPAAPPAAPSVETPVVATGTPVNVTVIAPQPPPTTVTKGEGVTLTPTTTEAEDQVTEGQRHINLIWETTQSRIAMMVVVAGVSINASIVLMIIFLNKEVSVTQLALISISLQFINLTVGIVIGFYFSRTNHQNQGGIGRKPDENYTGR